MGDITSASVWKERAIEAELRLHRLRAFLQKLTAMIEVELSRQVRKPATGALFDGEVRSQVGDARVMASSKQNTVCGCGHVNPQHHNHCIECGKELW